MAGNILDEFLSLQEAHHRKSECIARTLRAEWIVRGAGFAEDEAKVDELVQQVTAAVGKGQRRKALRKHRNAVLEWLNERPSIALPPINLNPASVNESRSLYMDSLASTLAVQRIKTENLSDQGFLQESVVDLRQAATFDDRIHAKYERILEESRKYVKGQLMASVASDDLRHRTLDEMPWLFWEKLDALLVDIDTLPIQKRRFESPKQLNVFLSWIAIRNAIQLSSTRETTVELAFEPKPVVEEEERLHEHIREAHGRWVEDEYPALLMSWLNELVVDTNLRGTREIPRWRSFQGIAPLLDPASGRFRTRPLANAIVDVWLGSSHSEVARRYSTAPKVMTVAIKIGKMHAESEAGQSAFSRERPALTEGVFEEVLIHSSRTGAPSKQV